MIEPPLSEFIKSINLIHIWAFFWIVLTLVVIILDLKFIWDGETSYFKDLVKTEEIRVYHLIVIIVLIPAWIIEAIAYYVVWKSFKFVFEILSLVLNITVVRRGSQND